MLQNESVNLNIVNYLDTPPNAQQLKDILQKLGVPAEQIVRKGDDLFKKLGLHQKNLDDDGWVAVLVENPQLIERPIVVNGDKAAIGRPIENVIAILESS